jgi:hypothetical protein
MRLACVERMAKGSSCTPSPDLRTGDSAVRRADRGERKGHKPARPKEPANDDKVIDLMAALRNSLKVDKGPATRRASNPRRNTRAKKPSRRRVA